MKKLIILSILFLQGCSYFNEIELKNICITDKTLAYSHGKTQYKIYTKTETFEITYSIVKMRFDGSELYGVIEKGKCYNLTVYGFRSPFLGMYRNILKAELNN